MKKHNFSAGPSILPQEVLKKASEAVNNFNGIGLSLIEISHRSKEFIEVMETSKKLVKELLNLPEGYSVLFLQGGASLEFLMTAYNLLKVDGKAAYIDSGAWSAKALKEAKFLGEVDVIASSKDKIYNYIPKNYTIPTNADYVHYTSNNTIYGTQFKEFPKGESLLVCDMSSDIFSRVLDFSKFDLVYAGAQKNMGPAGTTLVIVKDEILGETGRAIPSMLDYQTHISKDSMFNTPPVFAVYTSMLTLQWLKNLGGVSAIEKLNNEKAAALYAEIDRNPHFKGFAEVEDRSLMNVTFNLTIETHKDAFNALCDAASISGLKGHRSVGGYRASIYNAMSIESVQVLVNAMQQLEKQLA
ncbi:MAG: 3-phosphoserine/phosphohydroxythreonine transaminase [Lutibacter sp.]|uniref:3-phosphoserine/phosphohydroxythreonine transaminase n=1 Tax=Lutibacter sp. TaxID=1925666 RepID=UPI001A041B09|nr:3-phosphoserine/phosphohydroxythreonine transaminase [Lutibacter sp.]NOR28421.1 3-phosphoserine/phosphohydroxythreonine transaminase [Lutibacter sp.]